MKYVLLALVVLGVSACGSTKSAAPAGPCPERTEPIAGSGCSVEGTRCEYVIAMSCETDQYHCTSGKWAKDMQADAAAGCKGGIPLADGGSNDGAQEAATDAPAD